ncbi:MAG: hypothetical protein ACJ74Q_01920 [Pyrinomonadaceae bacterium]
MSAEEEGIPTNELREYIYFEGIELRKEAQKLLKECRDFRVKAWDALGRRQIHGFSTHYDELYDRYIKHDANVSSYCGMASNPWTRDEEGERVMQDPRHLNILNISSIGLTSQRETIRSIFQDISNQINGRF